MAESTPVIYFLHGEDEYAIAQTLTELEKRLGDQATAEMNTTRLDGATYDIDKLLSVASALPFLAKRRLVVDTTDDLQHIENILSNHDEQTRGYAGYLEIETE